MGARSRALASEQGGSALGPIHEACGWFMHTRKTQNTHSISRKETFFRPLRGRFHSGTAPTSPKSCLRVSFPPLSRINEATNGFRHGRRGHSGADLPGAVLALAGELDGAADLTTRSAAIQGKWCVGQSTCESRRGKTDVARSSLADFLRMEAHLLQPCALGSSCNHHSLSPHLSHRSEDR